MELTVPIKVEIDQEKLNFLYDDGYKQGRADAYIDMIEVKSIILTRPRFMSALKYLEYLMKTFPREWLSGWNDSNCKTYKLLIPTIKEKKNE